MTKTQIRVPEEPFQQLRALAKQRDWSLAETFRRGAELLLQVYPEPADKAPVPWTPPTSNRVGWKGLSCDELIAVVLADGNRRQPHP